MQKDHPVDTKYFHSHHKCASRWTLSYLEKVSVLNGLSFFHGDRTQEVVKKESGLAFFGNSSYEFASSRNLSGVHFVRNPLNIIVSAYFSHLNTHPEGGWDNLTKQRKLLAAVELIDGLHLTNLFLDRYEINNGAVGPLFSLRNWDYNDHSFVTVRVEDLVRHPAAEMRKLPSLDGLELPDDAQFTFSSFARGREVGQTDDSSHYRSGDPNEWRKYIPPAILRYVQTYFAPLLRNYYPDVMLEGQLIDRPFYELSEDVRIALTKTKIAERATIHERWQNLTAEEALGWNSRLAVAAQLLTGYRSIADLGCGTMQLAKYIEGGVQYIPVDVTKRDARTVVVDFNRDGLPSTLSAECATILGVLEYVFDIEFILKQCRSLFKGLVISYNVTVADFNLDIRRSHAWVNDLSKVEIEQLFISCGWRITNSHTIGDSESIWKLV